MAQEDYPLTRKAYRNDAIIAVSRHWENGKQSGENGEQDLDPC